MRAACYEQFSGPIEIVEVPDPIPTDDGVVLAVRAAGVCRSDWHGWMGEDPDIVLPHVPGHEMAGEIVGVGRHVRQWRLGDRVTVPFVGGCGRCSYCQSGQQQVCDDQFQPGFTHWGCFAELVSIHRADLNLVRLPESMDFVAAASLGCRFVTAFRAIVDQGRITPGQWIVVHGCGGVGMSAVMIASAMGAQVIAVDINPSALSMCRELGASAILDAGSTDDIPAAVYELTTGGAHVSIDALGSTKTSLDSIACLRKQGRHVQVGLMTGNHRTPPVPMDRVLSHELEIVGSHGMQAHRYPAMLAMIANGQLQPEALLGKTIRLEDVPTEIESMGKHFATGVTVVDRF